MSRNRRNLRRRQHQTKNVISAPLSQEQIETAGSERGYVPEKSWTPEFWKDTILGTVFAVLFLCCLMAGIIIFAFSLLRKNINKEINRESVVIFEGGSNDQVGEKISSNQVWEENTDDQVSDGTSESQ